MNARGMLTVLVTLTLMLVGAACDFSPSSPFEGFENGGEGATLNGRVQGGGVAFAPGSRQSATGFAAQSALASEELTATKVLIYVDGVEVGSVEIKDDGSFTIRGLPDAFTLQFVNDNGDMLGSEDFTGVKPNQEIDIVVAMVGGELRVVEQKRTGIDHEGGAGIELEGTAENVTWEPDRVTGSLRVDGYRVITRFGETSIRKGQRSLDLSDVRGKQVHVRGVFEGDDVFAYEIKLQEEEEDDEGEEKVTLCHIPPGNPDKAHTITVGASAVPAHLAHGDYLGACK